MLKVKKGHYFCDGTNSWLMEHNQEALFWYVCKEIAGEPAEPGGRTKAKEVLFVR